MHRRIWHVMSCQVKSCIAEYGMSCHVKSSHAARAKLTWVHAHFCRSFWSRTLTTTLAGNEM
jgi:hypothetical protein